MNKTNYLLIAVIATMLYNGNAKPLTNIYPVYRSEKQLDTSNRYENSYKVYQRIDIPYNGEFVIKNSSKSVVDYVPVALTIKKPNIKVWPNDHNGMTNDDLSLYNFYTQSVNPNHVNTQGHVQPFHVYTQPIQVIDRPSPLSPDRPPPRPPDRPIQPSYPSEPHPVPSIYPPAPEPTPPSPTSLPPPGEATPSQLPNCPNITITSITSITNSNLYKEGCQDVNIQITSNVNNTNTGLSRPSNTIQRPGIGLFDAIWRVLSSFTVDPPKAENVSKSSPIINIESIATVARASNDGSPLPSPTALGQMLNTVSQLVESDIRTPPKLKEIIKEKANEHKKEVPGENSTPLPYTFIYDEFGQFEEKHHMTDKTLVVDFSEGKASEGVKGIAIPVVMDEDYEVTTPGKKLQKIPEVPKPVKDENKKTGVTKTQPTTTPSSGLSTWILLSDNKDVTTPSPKKNNKKDDEKKKGGATTTKKPGTTQKPTTQSNKKVTSKPTKKPEAETTGISALEALVKNQKKNPTTTSKPKQTEPKKKVPDKLETAETKDKANIELTDPTLFSTSEVALTTSQSSGETTTTTETTVEGTTKKKTTTKKKKKNKNRRKKPTEETGIEAKIPPQPVGSQIYNFLSREIVPTVGLGLIGVALTAGLASFLGYNPFGSLTVPLRRTYDTHHGYTPNYYNYNTDYGDGGQSEEVLFREVLSGMPEDSRYGMADTNYPEAYNRQDHIYSTATEKEVNNYDSTYPQDYSTGYGTYDSQSKVKEKYPVYTRETGTSFVYPETTGNEKTSRTDDYPTKSTGDTYPNTNPDTIERQPEALYRVASDSELQYRNGESAMQGASSQNSWHRIGSPMEAKKSHPMLEPGPRSLDLTKDKTKKRSKRAVESVIQRISRKRTKKENDEENEIDFDDNFNGSKFPENDILAATTTTTPPPSPTTDTPTTPITTTTEEGKEVTPTDPAYDPDEVPPSPPSGVSVLDVLKRLAQFKLRLGLNFLRSTTDMFSRYLDDIQRRVDESFANTTTTTVQYNRKSPWSRIFFSRLNDDESQRQKRSVLEDNHLIDVLLAAVDSINEKYSTKKDLRLSDKTVLDKKSIPKKYEAKGTN